MKILDLTPQPDYCLLVVADDGRSGIFDVSPYLGFEAFEPLKSPDEFNKVCNRGYFIEWECGADLSADTLEARTCWSYQASSDIGRNINTQNITLSQSQS